jgi:hypothetical protein
MHPQFGLAAVTSELDEEAKQTLSDAFIADPKWQAKGPPLFEDPGSGPGGRIIVELFQDVAPKTVENFLCLCTGERGVGKASKKPLHYKVPVPLERLSLQCSPQHETSMAGVCAHALPGGVDIRAKGDCFWQCGAASMHAPHNKAPHSNVFNPHVIVDIEL